MIVGTAVMALIALQFTKHKEITRISWDKVAQFLGFLTLLTIVRISAYDFMLQSGIIKQLPQMYPEVLASKWTLVLVFWEDVFFGIPIYFVQKYMTEGWKKYLKWPLTIAISVLFGMGHAYQGMQGIIITSLIPYFICYRYGKEYGFGTTMVAHIMYDVFTVYSVILLPYLLY